MKTLAFTASSILALLVVAYFGVLYVPEAATGVRLKMGSATEETIPQGIHISIPWLYEIQVFSGAIHISQLEINVDGHACEPGPRAKLRTLWRIVDARRFMPLVAASPGTSVAALGERQILQTFCALSKAHPEASKHSGSPSPNLEDGSMETLLNQSLVQGFGVEVLNMSKSTR
ncbi:hypothetical protein [Acidovorax sp. Root217]|uniref:hypothetical protein n=1 Tax=Acidovorax sp. Root217 TaxID=1736492 RepID=UPI000714A42E|nr:hypothetical protein [Acidovorax sp. Root217]KRC19059.1 hypothetical protein ASE31_05300 [Acidovorax sp. Root217]